MLPNRCALHERRRFYVGLPSLLVLLTLGLFRERAETFWGPGGATFAIFVFFSDFFRAWARLRPDFGPLSLQTLIFDGLWGRSGGAQTPKILKKP